MPDRRKEEADAIQNSIDGPGSGPVDPNKPKPAYSTDKKKPGKGRDDTRSSAIQDTGQGAPQNPDDPDSMWAGSTDPETGGEIGKTKADPQKFAMKPGSMGDLESPDWNQGTDITQQRETERAKREGQLGRVEDYKAYRIWRPPYAMFADSFTSSSAPAPQEEPAAEPSAEPEMESANRDVEIIAETIGDASPDAAPDGPYDDNKPRGSSSPDPEGFDPTEIDQYSATGSGPTPRVGACSVCGGRVHGKPKPDPECGKDHGPNYGCKGQGGDDPAQHTHAGIGSLARRGEFEEPPVAISDEDRGDPSKISYNKFHPARAIESFGSKAAKEAYKEWLVYDVSENGPVSLFRLPGDSILAVNGIPATVGDHETRTRDPGMLGPKGAGDSKHLLALRNIDDTDPETLDQEVPWDSDGGISLAQLGNFIKTLMAESDAGEQTLSSMELVGRRIGSLGQDERDKLEIALSKLGIFDLDLPSLYRDLTQIIENPAQFSHRKTEWQRNVKKREMLDAQVPFPSEAPEIDMGIINTMMRDHGVYNWVNEQLGGKLPPKQPMQNGHAYDLDAIAQEMPELEEEIETLLREYLTAKWYANSKFHGEPSQEWWAQDSKYGIAPEAVQDAIKANANGNPWPLEYVKLKWQNAALMDQHSRIPDTDAKELEQKQAGRDAKAQDREAKNVEISKSIGPDFTTKKATGAPDNIEYQDDDDETAPGEFPDEIGRKVIIFDGDVEEEGFISTSDGESISVEFLDGSVKAYEPGEVIDFDTEETFDAIRATGAKDAPPPASLGDDGEVSIDDDITIDDLPILEADPSKWGSRPEPGQDLGFRKDPATGQMVPIVKDPDSRGAPKPTQYYETEAGERVSLVQQSDGPAWVTDSGEELGAGNLKPEALGLRKIEVSPPLYDDPKAMTPRLNKSKVIGLKLVRQLTTEHDGAKSRRGSGAEEFKDNFDDLREVQGRTCLVTVLRQRGERSGYPTPDDAELKKLGYATPKNGYIEIVEATFIGMKTEHEKFDDEWDPKIVGWNSKLNMAYNMYGLARDAMSDKSDLEIARAKFPMWKERKAPKLGESRWWKKPTWREYVAMGSTPEQKSQLSSLMAAAGHREGEAPGIGARVADLGEDAVTGLLMESEVLLRDMADSMMEEFMGVSKDENQKANIRRGAARIVNYVAEVMDPPIAVNLKGGGTVVGRVVRDDGTFFVVKGVGDPNDKDRLFNEHESREIAWADVHLETDEDGNPTHELQPDIDHLNNLMPGFMRSENIRHAKAQQKKGNWNVTDLPWDQDNMRWLALLTRVINVGQIKMGQGANRGEKHSDGHPADQRIEWMVQAYENQPHMMGGGQTGSYYSKAAGGRGSTRSVRPGQPSREYGESIGPRKAIIEALARGVQLNSGDPQRFMSIANLSVNEAFETLDNVMVLLCGFRGNEKILNGLSATVFENDAANEELTVGVLDTPRSEMLHEDFRKIIVNYNEVIVIDGQAKKDHSVAGIARGL